MKFKYKLFSLFFLLIASFSLFSKEIIVKHMPEGDNCVICHYTKTPHQLLLRDGSKIDSGNVTILCAQCHGIKYRDWLKGRHGKFEGSWKPEFGKRLSCVACHDPHIPKFPKFEAKEPPLIRLYGEQRNKRAIKGQ